MKNTLKTLLCAIALILFLPTLNGCKTSEGRQDLFLQTAKAFTKANIQKLFPEARIDRDSVHLVGKFAQSQVSKILGQSAREFLTKQGQITLDNLNFKAYIQWERPAPDKVQITVHYINKNPKTTAYRYEKDTQNSAYNSSSMRPCLPNLYRDTEAEDSRRLQSPNGSRRHTPQQDSTPHRVFRNALTCRATGVSESSPRQEQKYG